MIYPFDFHVHSTFCDGKSTLEETVKSAIQKGMVSLGFSGHSYTDFDSSYCMSECDTEKYIAKINVLKEKYKDKINIFCGVEKDYYSDINTDNFDYVIGSVHYCKQNEKYIDIDLSVDDFIKSTKLYFNDDYYLFCESYFKNVADVYNRTKCDIIGHFDLITKFNEQDKLFNTNDKRYVDMAISAVDKLLQQNVIFEINTGAISRGYKVSAYPDQFILERIKEKGGSIILSSDCHFKDNLMYDFDNAIDYIKSVGFNKVKSFDKNGFYDVKI